jgi:hypothetical protein
VIFFDDCVIRVACMIVLVLGPESGESTFFPKDGKLLRTTRRYIPADRRANLHSYGLETLKYNISCLLLVPCFNPEDRGSAFL